MRTVLRSRSIVTRRPKYREQPKEGKTVPDKRKFNVLKPEHSRDNVKHKPEPSQR